MIYSIIIIDAESGILLLENKIKVLDKTDRINSEILGGFFKALNDMIDEIQKSMKKGRDVSNMTRVIDSEASTIILHYQPFARVLFCSISDPDDDREKIIEILKILGKRFWKKHRVDIGKFRQENIRDIFNSFKVDIEIYSLEGKAAEKFPKCLIAEMALERVFTMGMVEKMSYEIAKLCDGKTSILKISKKLDASIDNIKRGLNKLEDIDIVKIP
ncbi:MAG: hypothetical protein ACTSWY_00490 [Promethearchaeota archaeon]